MGAFFKSQEIFWSLDFRNDIATHYRQTSISRIPREWKIHFDVSEIWDKQKVMSPEFIYYWLLFDWLKLKFFAIHFVWRFYQYAKVKKKCLACLTKMARFYTFLLFTIIFWIQLLTSTQAVVKLMENFVTEMKITLI